jgi:hypothetical protein
VNDGQVSKALSGHIKGFHTMSLTRVGACAE